MEESACRGINQEADTSTKNQNKKLADGIIVQLESMRSSSMGLFGSRMIRINRVPHHIRSVHPQAYTPMVVSIGPIHHFDEKLLTMEKQKAEYLISFMRRFGTEDLETFVGAVRDLEGVIRRCYGETSSHSMSSDDFVKMILLDAIFILELFLRYSAEGWGGVESDPLQINQWMFSFVRLDLVLLENQLPFFVLKKLYDLVLGDFPSAFSLNQLAFHFFEYFNVQRMGPENVVIEHFTDLIRAFRQPVIPLRGWRGRTMVTLSYSATALHDSGVKFEEGDDLRYENGVLKMPRLELDDQTEALVRNVMALEQFCQWNDVYLTDYFIFLDFLVNTIEDINLLCVRGILVNKLVDNKAALSMVKSLVTNITGSGTSYDITIICEMLNEFYNRPFNRWKARLSVTTLKNQYFNNPWRGAGTIAACLLLLLALIQTIISVLQVAKA